MGPFFGFPPLKISRPLHKIIRVERVEGIPQLVRKTVNRFVYLRLQIGSDDHTGTDGYIYLAFLQLTFFNEILTLSDFMYRYKIVHVHLWRMLESSC
jgi:hypothetical protein